VLLKQIIGFELEIPVNRRFEGTLVLTRAARRNIPEDGILHSHCCENITTYNIRGSSEFEIA
jgi:hypothetical protein